MTAAALASDSPQVRANTAQSIGSMLVDSGRINLEEAEQILRLQKTQGIRFGEAAVQLGLLTDDDIQHALSRQYGYRYLRRGESHISEAMVAAYAPHSPQVEALRALRSQLMLRWFAPDAGGHKTLAVVGTGRGEGRSYLAANLAIVFSQLGESTLLIDADLRHGRQHLNFQLDNLSGLSTVLSGRISAAPVLRLAELESLSVLTAGPVPPNPQELLGRDIFSKMIDKFAQMFDVVIIDTPAGTDYADAQTIAARAGGALMVVRENTTSIDSAQSFTSGLTELGVSLVGAVVSKF